ncbi:MAG TPA: PBP1A family penicillin-binding protein [Polyangiaceae bacterium]|nr:PBP1A family penicillin-binding protein [Polyangiaceae bacterium]
MSRIGQFFGSANRSLKWILISLLLLVALAAGSVFLVIRHYEAELPSVAELRTGYRPPQVTRVLARDGTLLANLFRERRTVIPLSDVPDHAKLAFLAAEDAHFYEHEGLNYFGMLRAMLANLRAGKTRQGGSTITQQVVKNVLLEPERTYRRKIRETILARRLEQHLSKDEIFALYLNHIYLGHGRYGIEEASRYYFGKKAKQLSLPEAALLAGVVAAPERFSPRNARERSLDRRRYVLAQMLEKGFITQALHADSAAAPLRLAPAVEAESELAPEVISHVEKVLGEVAGEDAGRGGFVVTTTLDPAMQAAARKAVRDNLARYAERQKLIPPLTAEKRRLWGAASEGTPSAQRAYIGTVVALDDRAGTLDVRVGSIVGRVALLRDERYNPKRLPPSEFTKVGALLRVHLLNDPEGAGRPDMRLDLGPQSALVAIDVRTRHVLALIGNVEALAGGLDRATRSRRQPGSAFKPFVYSYALHSRRFTPASVLTLPADPRHKLEARRISIRDAVAKSDNTAAIQVFKEVGPANVVQWARALGIQSKLEPNASLALGAYEVTPLEITNAFATFASGGEYAPPVLVSKIIGPDGKELPLPPDPPRRRVMQEDEAYVTTSLLRSVVQAGTARRASGLGRPLAGKTGTTNDAKDAWFVGYSTEIVSGVWVGYDDPSPLGWGEAGGTTALPAWMDFMKAAHGKRPVTEFPRPGSVIVSRIDPGTGLLAYDGQEGAIDEEFLDGTVPTESAVPDAGTEEALGAVESETLMATTPGSTVPDAGAAVDLPAARVAPDMPITFGQDAGVLPEPPPF